MGTRAELENQMIGSLEKRLVLARSEWAVTDESTLAKNWRFNRSDRIRDNNYVHT